MGLTAALLAAALRTVVMILGVVRMRVRVAATVMVVTVRAVAWLGWC